MLALGVFALDTATNVDIVVPVLYVNVVLLAMRSGQKSDIAAAGWGSVGLTIVSFTLTVRPEVPTSTALFNTALSILTIMCVTILGLRSARSQEEILRARGRVAAISRGIFLRTLSASVAQEITQPIAAISANAEAAYLSLSESPPDLKTTTIATHRIVQNVERVSAVVGRVRRSTAAREICYEICNTLDVIESAVEHLRLEIDDAGIDVSLECPPDLPIIADKVLIEQVVAAAIANSIETLRSIETSPRRILLQARALPGNVQISIEDNGTRVDVAAMEQIFDPFFATKIGSGMGVGLAASKSIIEVHDGTIRSLPQTPNGMIIEITLPTGGFLA